MTHAAPLLPPEEQITMLKAHIQYLKSMAAKAALLNDADNVKGNVMKAHKIMLALAAYIPGYDHDIDAAYKAGQSDVDRENAELRAKLLEARTPAPEACERKTFNPCDAGFSLIPSDEEIEDARLVDNATPAPSVAAVAAVEEALHNIVSAKHPSGDPMKFASRSDMRDYASQAITALRGGEKA